MGDNNPKCRIREDSEMSGLKNLLKKLNSEPSMCCSNKSIYRITYNLGTRWLVCNECLEHEFFNSGISKKVRIKN